MANSIWVYHFFNQFTIFQKSWSKCPEIVLYAENWIKWKGIWPMRVPNRCFLNCANRQTSKSSFCHTHENVSMETTKLRCTNRTNVRNQSQWPSQNCVFKYSVWFSKSDHFRCIFNALSGIWTNTRSFSIPFFPCLLFVEASLCNARSLY